MSRKHKARVRLEQSRKKGMLKGRLALNGAWLSLVEAQLSLASQRYEDSMTILYRDADAAQRVALEKEYQKVAGSSLKSVFESRILAALQSQPRGVCDHNQAK
jgi:hypothetical protein